MTVSGGQFISFLNEICYESNKNSVGVGHGTLKLNKSYSNGSLKFEITAKRLYAASQRVL